MVKTLNDFLNSKAGKVFDKIQDGIAKIAPVLMAIALSGMAFAADDVSIGDTVKKVVFLVYAVLYLSGGISLIMGIVSVAGAMSEDGQGDPQQLSKGKGRLIRGAILIAAPTLLNLFGFSPDGVSSKFSSLG